MNFPFTLWPSSATVTHSHFHHCRLFVCFNLLLPFLYLWRLSYCNCCAFKRKRKITTVKIGGKLHIKRGKKANGVILTIESLFLSCLQHILYFSFRLPHPTHEISQFNLKRFYSYAKQMENVVRSKIARTSE
jgi:hypothetical protein